MSDDTSRNFNVSVVSEPIRISFPEISETSLTDTVSLCDNTLVNFEAAVKGERNHEEEGYVAAENEIRSSEVQDSGNSVDVEVEFVGENNVLNDPIMRPDSNDYGSNLRVSRISTSYLGDAEMLEWHQSLAGQASILSLEHQKMADFLVLQKQCQLEELKLRCELTTWQKDRLLSRKWRDKLLHDKLSEIQAATLEMKDLISKLDKANPSWKNKVHYVEMF